MRAELNPNLCSDTVTYQKERKKRKKMYLLKEEWGNGKRVIRKEDVICECVKKNETFNWLHAPLVCFVLAFVSVKKSTGIV